MIGNYSSIRSTSRPHGANEKSDEIKHHLHLIFIYYASFADRNNYHLLKHQNYRRFLIDSEMVKSTNEFPQFDILFKKISKGQSNAINFDEFLKLLPELAMSIYESDSRQTAFKKLIKNDIKGLEEEIRSNSEFGQDLSVIQGFFDQERNHDEKQISKKLEDSPILKKCYSIYISSTSMHQKNPSDTFESFYKFLKDFELSPQLIYKSICYVAFINMIESKTPKHRNSFDIQSFVILIQLLGQIIIRKQYAPVDNLCSTGKICKILQKMQVSSGFQKISKQIKGQSYFSMSLVRLIMGDEQYQTDKDHCLKSLDQSLDRISSGLVRHKGCSVSTKRDPNLNNLNSSFESANTLAQNEPQQYRQIKRIFENLCSYGEVGNDKTLKSMKVKKLFGQVGLLKVMSQVDLDLLITEIVRTSQSGKMQFEHFVELLNETASRLTVPQSEVYDLIINSAETGHLTDMGSASKAQYSNEELELLMEMLECTAYPLEKIFHFYSKSRNEISFSEMTKLMYDFEVFPSVLTKNRLYQIFLECYEESRSGNGQQLHPQISFGKDKFNSIKKYQSLSRNVDFSRFNSTNQGPTHKSRLVNSKDQKYLSISAFPLLLLKASHEICQEELTAAQKLIILIEKMHQSKGQQKVVLGKGSLVSELRKNYANIYKMSLSANRPSQKDLKQDVEDLLDTISEY